MIGRDLRPDEEVDHIDQDRRNFHFSNLVIRGHADHGWKSAKQAGFLKQKLSAREQQEYQDWQEFMQESDRRWAGDVAACRANGQVWQGASDGNLQREYEQWRHRREQSRRKKERERKKLADLHLPPRDKDWMRAATKGNAGVVPF